MRDKLEYNMYEKLQTPKQDSTVYSFLLLFIFLQSLIHSRFHPSPSLLITYCSYKTFL